MASEAMAAGYAAQVATWFSKGYAGGGNVAGLIDSLQGCPAVVVGSGKGVFDEVAEARSRLGECVVFAVNDVAVLLPHVDHMVSLHTPKLVLWAELRRDATSQGYGNKDFQIHDGGMFGKHLWHQWTGLTPMMAQSGLFAAQIAYLMGCAPIVLAGVPCDETPRFWESEPKAESYYAGTRRQLMAEMSYKPDFKKVVRSMSGWTRGYFGEV